MSIILPHGGKLVKRIIATEADEKRYLSGSGALRIFIDIKPRVLSDLEMIATGGLSPLEGFMTGDDYFSVLENMRLANGLPWTIPISLDVSKEVAKDIGEGDVVGLRASLKSGESVIVGVIYVEEKFSYDKKETALAVYGTDDIRHPGVSRVFNEDGDILLGGEVYLLWSGWQRYLAEYDDFGGYRLYPEETRKIFLKRGWKKIVGFQTRNPIHRAHEYLTKCALEVSDGILIHPIAGETKKDDIPLAIRMRCYEALVKNYFPENRALIALNPASMRYAGPREAVFHAIIRKNYGCTHFIVGRDHAGVGNFYGSYDAQKIFERFEPEDLGIEPLFFENSFWCDVCGGMASYKTCPHPDEKHFGLSGTKLRALLSSGKDDILVSDEMKKFTRPEVAEILAAAFRQDRQ